MAGDRQRILIRDPPRTPVAIGPAIAEDPRMTARRAGLELVVVVLTLPACTRHDGNAARKTSYPGAVTVDVAHVRFDDGDTFFVDGDPIRVLGIDTPEIADSSVGIFEDQPFGPAAAESTEAWIRRARVVEIATDGRDRYQRRLAHVFLDGDLLAERLLGAGLAYETVSHYGDNGFPDLADRILRAAHASPKPHFEEPYRWRRKHQRPVTAP
jgi:endonuclease YncB( thermonuclease family)